MGGLPLSVSRLCFLRGVVTLWVFGVVVVGFFLVVVPRHFFLYSHNSLNMLAEKTKFKIREIVYDSDEFQFWGSQQYLKGIPLMAENSYGRNPAKSIFSQEEIKNFKETARKLNSSSRGDQAVVFLVKN